MGAPAASEAAIARALGAAISKGLTVTGFSVSKDGTINVTTGRPIDESATDVQPLTPRKWAKR